MATNDYRTDKIHTPLPRPKALVLPKTASKFVQSTDGTRIFADAVGDPAKQALVFTHGFSTDCTIFDELFNHSESTKNFFLIRYDLRGAGRSGKPTTADLYASHNYAEDFAAVLSAFEVTKPILAGWSMGTMVINDVLTHLPDGTIRGAVCIAGTPCLTPAIAAAFNPLLDPIRAALFSPDVHSFERANITLNRLLFLRNPSPPADIMAETVRAIEAGSDFADDNPAVSWATRNAALGVSLLTNSAQRRLVATREHNSDKTVAAGESGFPVLLILGESDPFADCGRLLDGMKSMFKNLEVHVISDGCHAPFLDAPEEVLDQILHFSSNLL